ncbi:hypothetical protein [Cupriavidus gilardii]|uniref:hypothetical protein n=1 Tax=Cupriavidus gilardii TaxID=82541 RepID=UPI001EE61960|nr:hypothetical protein [Cupriavidus gilardii]
MAPPDDAIQRDCAEPEGKPGALRQFLRDLRPGRQSLRLNTTGVSLMSSAVQEVEPLLESTDAISPNLVEASEVLPAGDAVLGVVDLVGTAAGKFAAWRRVAASEPRYRRAVAVLAHSRLPAEVERRKAALKATRHWIRACLATARANPDRPEGAPAPAIAAHRLRQHATPLLHDTFHHALTAGNAGACALGQAAMGVIDRELAAIDRERDAIIRQHCADVLDYQGASRDDRRATQRLRGSAIACLRDSGLQGLRVGYEASPLAESAWQAPLDLGMIPAEMLSFGFGAAIGLAHVGCGIGELAEARHRMATLQQIRRAVGDNLSRMSADPARRKRLQSPAATKALRWFADGQRRWRQRAVELARWAVGRIAYGVGTVLLSSAGIATMLTLGTVALASTAGTLLVAGGVVLGGAWFLFTLIKIARRFGQSRADSRENKLLARAVRRGAARGLCAETLSQCSLAQLESLPREFPALPANRYWQAAVLTRRLLIEDAADKIAGKAARLETSAVLQALGMSKLSTTLLKHAGFELAYRTIFLYLHGDGAQSAWSEGTFHRVETARERGPAAHGG